MTKIKKGYHINITTLENDGDNYLTKEVVVDTMKEVQKIVRFINYFYSCQSGDDFMFGNANYNKNQANTKNCKNHKICVKQKSRELTKTSDQEKLETIPLRSVKFQAFQPTMFSPEHSNDSSQKQHSCSSNNQKKDENYSVIVSTNICLQSSSSFNNQTQPTSRVWLNF